jgi:hypothetical protein
MSMDTSILGAVDEESHRPHFIARDIAINCRSGILKSTERLAFIESETKLASLQEIR